MAANANWLTLACSSMLLAAPTLAASGTANGGDAVHLAQFRDRDWNDKDWDRGGDGKGRRAASRREERAIDFIQEFYRRSSESTPDAYKFVASAYATEVNYYGKKRSREGVLADKFAWMERWPVRDYRVREETAEWQCNENARLCVIRVLVDFDARNPATGKVSRGVTTNELGVAVTNSDVQIEYENGKVLSRR